MADRDQSPPNIPRKLADMANNDKPRVAYFKNRNPDLLAALARNRSQSESADTQEPAQSQSSPFITPPLSPSPTATASQQSASTEASAIAALTNLAAASDSESQSDSSDSESDAHQSESAAHSSPTPAPVPEPVLQAAPNTASEEVTEEVTETQTPSAQPTGTQAPEVTSLSRLASVPIISSTLGTINDILSSNYFLGSSYNRAKKYSTKAYQYSLPIQKTLAPLIVRADSIANYAIDAVESRLPSSFQPQKSQQEATNHAES